MTSSSRARRAGEKPAVSGLMICPPDSQNPARGTQNRHSGTRRRREPGIHIPEAVFMDSGPRPLGDPGMTPRNRRCRQIALSDAEAVEARCGAGEEIGLFRDRGAARETLEGVEQHGIAAGALIDREIALEHAAVRAERLDA